MKKIFSILLIIMFVCVPVAQARTLTDTIKNMTIEGTASNLHDLTEDAGDLVGQGIAAVFDGAKVVVREGTIIVLKVVAAPFYWLEKIKK